MDPVWAGAPWQRRVSPTWQIVGDVGGCKMTHFADNYSGDSLTYMIGPRWTPSAGKQWEPFSQLLMGEERSAAKDESGGEGRVGDDGGETRDAARFPDHARYTTDTEVTGLAMSASAGVDVKLNPAIAFRVVDLGYMHSWHSQLDGVNYGNTVQLTAGLILRLGTW